ncbi:unnamed protein product [Gordionus sp. m RMFG-2023]
MIFKAFREFNYPTLYSPIKSLECDNFLIVFLYFCGSLIFSFFIILPGVRGKQRIYTFIYGCLTLMTGILIIICNYSYSWETASIITSTTFSVASKKNIICQISVHIGLRGFNVSLKGIDPAIITQSKIKSNHMSQFYLNANSSTNPLTNASQRSSQKHNINIILSHIHYNEAFRWEWEQGVQNYHSPISGKFIGQYNEARIRGTPTPILWVAQYFLMDAEKIRWGRHYRLAGYYSHILIWLSLPFWLLANILVYICIKYSGFFWILTGLSLLTANFVFWLVKCPVPLHIHLGDSILQFSFGISFWTTFYLGIQSIMIGLAIVFADSKCYAHLMAFFGIDVLQEYEDYLADPIELGMQHKDDISDIDKCENRLEKNGTFNKYDNAIDKDNVDIEMNGKCNMLKNNLNHGLKGVSDSLCSFNDPKFHSLNFANDLCYSSKLSHFEPFTQIPVLRKRGTSHSFFYRKKFSSKKSNFNIEELTEKHEIFGEDTILNSPSYKSYI